MNTTPIEGQYETYYGIHLNHYSYTWGGVTYNKLLTKAYPNIDLVSTVSTQSTSTQFIYPKLVGNPCYIDGVAEGHITLVNTDAATATIDDYTVALYKTDDVPNNATELGSYSNTLTANHTIAQNVTIMLPVYIIIDKQKIKVDEKIYLKISYNSTNGTVWIVHDNDSTYEDVKIKIPYAAEG